MAAVVPNGRSDILDQATLEAETIQAERTWLFTHIFPAALVPIREGLQECAELLQNAQMTLPLSSRENESLKGIMTRQGSNIIKGDILIKMNRVKLRLTMPSGYTMHLQQIEDVKSLVHYSTESLRHDLYEDTARRIVQDVFQNLRQASNVLCKQPTSVFPLNSIDPDSFRPEIPERVALDLYIQEASLVAEIRTLQPRGAENLFNALKRAHLGEMGGFVRYRGEDVKVVEHVRVESQDPALVAVTTKLSALIHAVEQIEAKMLATAQ